MSIFRARCSTMLQNMCQQLNVAYMEHIFTISSQKISTSCKWNCSLEFLFQLIGATDHLQETSKHILWAKPNKVPVDQHPSTNPLNAIPIAINPSKSPSFFMRKSPNAVHAVPEKGLRPSRHRLAGRRAKGWR